MSLAPKAELEGGASLKPRLAHVREVLILDVGRIRVVERVARDVQEGVVHLFLASVLKPPPSLGVLVAVSPEDAVGDVNCWWALGTGTLRLVHDGIRRHCAEDLVWNPLDLGERIAGLGHRTASPRQEERAYKDCVELGHLLRSFVFVFVLVFYGSVKRSWSAASLRLVVMPN